eukprot:COSAG01_NODE_16306_length_1248_cov_1.131419_3_plen_87_part_00
MILAKWEAEFLNLQRDGETYLPVTFVQVAMLSIDIQTGLICELEEYWTSKGKYGKGEQRGVMDAQVCRTKTEHHHTIIMQLYKPID